MTLYEMTEQAAALYELLCSEEIDEQMFEQVLNDTLEAIGADEKINSYCIVLRQLKADEEANKAEKKRFEGRIKMYANGQKRMKKALEDFLTATGKDKAKTDKFTLYHTTSKAVEVTDINAIPDEYIKPRREDDVMKSEIAKAIKDGKEIPGAVLVTNQPLVIR